MELIQGQPLLDSWDELTSLDKKSLCDQLCQIVSFLRQLGQFSSDKYIGAAQSHDNSKMNANWFFPGSINRQQLSDYVFQTQPEAAPFLNISDFNDWFSCLPQ